MQPWLSNILIKQIELTTVVYITGSSHCIDAAPSLCITRLQDACAAWICCIHACILAYILILTQYIYLRVRILTHTCTYAYLNVLTCCYRYPRTCVDFYLYLSCKSARNLLRISQGTGISCCCYKVGTIPNSTAKNLAKILRSFIIRRQRGISKACALPPTLEPRHGIPGSSASVMEIQKGLIS